MKIHKIAALGAVAALALTACSTDGEGGDKSTTAAPKPSASVDNSKRTITFWVADGGTNDAMRTILMDEFKAKTGATLKIEEIGWGELIPRLTTALPNADQTPDLVEVGSTQVPTFTSVGAFADLTANLAALGGDKLTPQGFVDAATEDGKVFATPYYSGPRYVFYSKSKFKHAGVEVPTTLAELGEAAKKLTKDKVSGFYLPGQDWRDAMTWVWANGGDIAKVVDGKWQGQFSSPESQAALAQLQDLYTNGTKAPKDGTDAEIWVPYNNGESAMFVAPMWAADPKVIPALEDTGAFALPGLTAGTAAPSLAGGSSIAISAQSKNQDLALELMKIVYGEKIQKEWAKTWIPAISDYASLLGDTEFAKAAIAASETSVLTPASPGWAQVEASKDLESFFGEIATGADPVAAAKKIDEKLNAALN